MDRAGSSPNRTHCRWSGHGPHREDRLVVPTCGRASLRAACERNDRRAASALRAIVEAWTAPQAGPRNRSEGRSAGRRLQEMAGRGADLSRTRRPHPRAEAAVQAGMRHAHCFVLLEVVCEGTGRRNASTTPAPARWPSRRPGCEQRSFVIFVNGSAALDIDRTGAVTGDGGAAGHCSACPGRARRALPQATPHKDRRARPGLRLRQPVHAPE